MAYNNGFNGGVNPKAKVEPIHNPADLKIFRQEEQLTQYGWCIPDFIGTLGELDNPEDPLIVLDWKTKNKVDTRSINTVKADFEISWQLKHYAWAVQEQYQRKVSHVGVVVVIMAPQLEVYYWPVPVNQDFLYNVWLPGARSTWAQMERIHAGVATPAMADSHYAYDDKGRCEYMNMCFKCDLDEDLALYEGYEQIEERL